MIRRTIFWTHLCVGVAAAVAILIMSITGVLLAFERQIVQFADRDLRTVTDPVGAKSRTLAEMLATASASAHARPSSLTIRPDATASVEFTFGRERNVYVDPYTGAVLGEGSKPVREFFTSVERWHRALGEPLSARGPFHSIAAGSNLLFLFLVVSGPYLWLPRKWSWTAVRAACLFRRGLRGRARDWNWHNVTGIWCAAPLLVLTLSGVIMSYSWANALLFRLAGSPPPAAASRLGPGSTQRAERLDRGPQEFAADLDKMTLLAGARFPGWQTLTLRIPRPAETTVNVTVDSGSGGEVEKRTQLLLDSGTGRIVHEARFADNSLGQRLRSFVRFLHTGEELGLAGQAIAAVSSAGAAMLVWTGLSLALRRWRRAAPARASAASRQIALEAPTMAVSGKSET